MIRFFAGHPTAAALLALAFAVAGVATAPGLQRDTFPDFRADRAEIRVAYPGATAEEVEEAICLALEDALDGVPGIDEMNCTARANVGVATIDIIHGYNAGRFLIDAKTEIDAIDTFPSQVERPVIRQLDVTEPVVSLAVAGPASAVDLKTLAEDIKSRLSRLPGVADVLIAGFPQRRMEIALDDTRLRAFGLSAASVAAAVERQSLDLPAGSVQTGERDLVIRFVDRRRSAAGLEQVVVRDAVDGGTVRLGDIATISESFVDEDERAFFNGEPAALISIRRASDDDALRVRSEVEAFVVAERERLPPSVTLALTNDVSSLIRDRLNMLYMNALGGFILICLVLWAFFSMRFALTVAAALPLSLLAAVFVMGLLGYTLNLLSTVALLIAVGLLIDSAIVINENIARHSQRGLSVLDAASEGVREVSGAVIASFATSVAIFAPLAFLEGDIGRVLLVLPVILIIALAASLVVSFLVLPFFTARALAGTRPTALRRRMDAALEHFRTHAVGSAIQAAVTWRYLTLGLVALAFTAALSLLAGGTVKFQAFADIEGDIVEARLMLVAGSPLQRTVESVDHLVDALNRVDAQMSVYNTGERALVENITVEFGRNADFADRGPWHATVKADLLGSEQRGARLAEILDVWRRETGALTDVASLTFKEPSIGPAGQALEVRLIGDDLVELQSAGAALVSRFERYDGVVDLITNLHPGPREIRIALREGAGRLGVDAMMIATALRSALQGVTADEIQIGREAIRVDVRHDAAWRSDLARLDDFAITLDDGRRVPLAAVATIDHGRGLVLIPRIDGRRTLSVTGDVDTARTNANEVLAAVEADFRTQLADRFPGVSMSLAGQAANQAETGASLRRVFAIGLIAMFIVLSFQFRSWSVPLIVMLAIPLALTGVVGGHWLMGIDMSMPSMVGFVSLAGIVVNNSILLVVFIRNHLTAGRPMVEAATRAGVERFRAIFMTTATTVAGLVPLLFETSVQAQVLVPLVTSLAFGLLTSTVLVLFLVPSLYAMLDDFASWRARQIAATTSSA